MAGPEYTDVEKPFIDQLVSQGWEYLAGSVSDPAVTHRDSFSQVVMEPLLKDQLGKINLRDGKRWLDEMRLNQAVSAITRIPSSKLLEANKQATALLLNGLTVEGAEDWDGGRGQVIRFIDWDEPTNNTFTVVNQFKVKSPPGHDSGKGHVIPDLVLFVNGIPLVVVECKSRTVPEGISHAVDQLRRYHDQRILDNETEEHEGAPALFATNQFLVASNFDEARVGSIGARFSHYLSWKTVAPLREADVATDLGVKHLSAQQRLIAGMLTPANLLDIVRHYTLFMNAGGQEIKLVCRYQQYRGMTRAFERLKHGKTRREDGESDRRGGIVWHTQGSGKSLSMVFLMRKIRTDPALRRFKVVVITDRKDLQEQLSATAELTGETVTKAGKTSQLKKLLAREGPGLVFGTIQKYRDPDSDDEPTQGTYAQAEQDQPDDQRLVAEPTVVSSVGSPRKPTLSAPFEVLNTSEDILIMVDEAHRTQAGDLHANMMRALPNAARIGFTGTPIIMGDKKRTHDIFGEYIDRYTIKEAEEDGATVPILYEGRTAKGAIKEGASLDGLFEDLFRDHTKEELEAIKKKYATKGQIFEAPQLVQEKAQDILRHYVTNILPNGYKAQLVSYSRQAASRYFDALEQAKQDLLKEAMALSAEDKQLDDTQLLTRPPKIKAAIQAWRYRKVLEELEFAVVFSSGNNDIAAWAKWSDRAAVESHIKRFKKPLPPNDATPADPTKHDSLAFLIVKSMLLTGFDAPIEGVMYLDRSLREAELLQAIARVNRTGHGKSHGIVVDYFGVANHLKEALAAYSEEDIEGALQSLKDEIPLLRDRHLRVVDVLRAQGVDDLDDTEEAVQVLGDERVRAEFMVKLKEFNRGLDDVLPRPEGLEFVNDAKRLAYIHAIARNRYKDTPELGKDIGNKVRKLIDDYVISLGIDPRIPPVQLTDASFDDHINHQASDRAKASEMEHAVRSHVSKHLEEDPAKYGRLSERLEELLGQLDGQWAEQVEAFKSLIQQLRDGASLDGEAIPDMPGHAEPFWRELVATCGLDPTNLAPTTAQKLLETTEEVVATIQPEIAIPDFWKPSHIPDQERLKQHLFSLLALGSLVPTDQAEATAERLVDLARSNHHKLVNA